MLSIGQRIFISLLDILLNRNIEYNYSVTEEGFLSYCANRHMTKYKNRGRFSVLIYYL